MSKPKSISVVQKKKRLTQLRDAQRRRRERLRSDKQHFVQIILPETTLGQLNHLISQTGETMQQVIARLVESALPQGLETWPIPASQKDAQPTTNEPTAALESDETSVEEPVSLPEIINEPAVFEPVSFEEEPEMDAASAPVVEVESHAEAAAEIEAEIQDDQTPTDVLEIISEAVEPEFQPVEAETDVEPALEIEPKKAKTAQLDLFG